MVKWVTLYGQYGEETHGAQSEDGISGPKHWWRNTQENLVIKGQCLERTVLAIDECKLSSGHWLSQILIFDYSLGRQRGWLIARNLKPFPVQSYRSKISE